MRVALRLARREVLRRPGRTLLVALLVALPVAGMSMSMVLVRSDHLTVDQEWQGSNGQADAVVYVSDPKDPTVPPPPTLPEGSRKIEARQTSLSLRTADHEHRSGYVSITDLPVADPIAHGRLDLTDGRAPDAAGEVAASRTVLDDLGADVGDEVVLDRPEATVRVVGVVEQAGCLSCRHLVTTPADFPAAVLDLPSAEWLVDLPADLTAAQEASLGANDRVQLRSTLRDIGKQPNDEGEDAVRWTLVIGAVVLTVMGIVISAAFAVGARRQLVALGQLSASGASPSLLRTSLVLQGTVTGLVGAAAGVAFGLGTMTAFHGPFEQIIDRRIEHLPIRATDLLAAVAVGVGAATVAALLPARSAAKVSTLSALAGRRPQSKVPARMIGFGTVAVIGGLALQGLAVLGGRDATGSGDVWAAVAIVGGVAELLGACAIAPAVVARLEPLAGRFRGSWRLAARSLARSRTRTGAVVSAVAATSALAILSVGLVRGYEARSEDHLELGARSVIASLEVSRQLDPVGEIWEHASEAPPADLVADLMEVLPEATRHGLRGVSFPISRGSGRPGEWTFDDPAFLGPFDGLGFVVDSAVVADDAVLDVAGVDAAARAELDRAGLGLLSKGGGAAPVLHTPQGDELGMARLVAEHSIATFGGPELLITEAKAEELGLPVADRGVLLQNPTDLTDDERDLVDDVWIDHQSDASLRGGELESKFLYVGFHHPDRGPSPLQIELILSGVALAFALFVVGVSLGLAAAESKDERDVLTVAGAPPGALARSAGARAVLLSVLGAAMAVPVGFLPVIVFSRATDDGFRLVFPTTIVAVLLVAVPVVVGLCALVTSAAAQRLHPVRVSTATWD